VSEHPPDDEKPDDALVERLRASFRAEDVPEGEPVDAERVWLAVTGELTAEERRAVVERVAADPAWAQAWRLARAMSQAASAATPPAARVETTASPLDLAARRPDPADRRESSGRRDTGLRARFMRSRPVWGAVAAMLALVVVGVSVQQKLEDRPRLRGGEAAAIVSGVPEGTPLPRAHCVLRWSGGPEGTRWTVRLSSEDLKVVHRAERLEHGEYQVPASVLAPLAPGARLLWQVEARLPDGQVLRGATFVNRIE
jgi:hypothetical protein